ncbi:N-6 DNA methylase [Alistipes onderdonkii]|uniref:N-6 DNA methylase n=1 Tax=Alistipes onderdonkii TaxID=328813 RepID=UPI003B8A6A75
MANLMAGIVNLMDEGIRVLDPCCGSGAFILSAARVSREQEFFGSDISLICCLMMLINMYLYDLTLQGSHRNLHRAQSCQLCQLLLRQ